MVQSKDWDSRGVTFILLLMVHSKDWDSRATALPHSGPEEEHYPGGGVHIHLSTYQLLNNETIAFLNAAKRGLGTCTRP